MVARSCTEGGWKRPRDHVTPTPTPPSDAWTPVRTHILSPASCSKPAAFEGRSRTPSLAAAAGPTVAHPLSLEQDGVFPIVNRSTVAPSDK